jgi:hypothetical protein
LQIAFERGVPTLLVWAAWLFVYGRMLWRMARGDFSDGDSSGGDWVESGGKWVERGLVIGALGGLVGFLAAGLVHYNFGDSEVVMVFYLIMGLALAVERFRRLDAGVQAV